METKNQSKILRDFLYHLVAMLCIIPLAPMINRVIPPLMIGSFNADLFVAILLSLLFVRFVLWLFKPLIIPSFVMIALIMIFNICQNLHGIQHGQRLQEYGDHQLGQSDEEGKESLPGQTFPI